VGDDTIQARITDLVERERQLRRGLAEGLLSEGEEHEELNAAEEELDQCWDLLRQRRAKREFGSDADEAQARSVSTVEHYWQ
jgi:hypothetical protein